MDNGSNNGYYLYELVELKNGNTNITKNYIKNNHGDFPVYSSSINNNGYVGSIDTYDFDGEYITITKDGNVGDIFYRNNKFSVSSSIVLNVINDSVLLTKYLYFYLLFNQNKIKQIANCSSTINHLYIRDLKNIKIFPPLVTIQQKIIDIIEPIEKLENTIIKFNKNIDLVIYQLIKKSKDIKELSQISQIQKFTKLINKKDLSENAKYYYSTGKTISKNKKTNLFNFNNGISIAYEGSVIDGKYFSPQIHLDNVYIARKWGIKSIFYFSIFYSMKFTIAQPYITYGTKMISISQERLKNIPISCANEKENYILKKLHLLITKINNLKNKLSFLKNKLLQLLIK